MDSPELQTASLHRLLDLLRAGDRAAENELVTRVQHRMQRLCHVMLRDFVQVRGVEETADERECFGLIYYHGWRQADVADLFQVNERTVRRWWVRACLRIKERLGHELPPAS